MMMETILKSHRVQFFCAQKSMEMKMYHTTIRTTMLARTPNDQITLMQKCKPNRIQLQFSIPMYLILLNYTSHARSKFIDDSDKLFYYFVELVEFGSFMVFKVTRFLFFPSS